jgi:hypothetical protein
MTSPSTGGGPGDLGEVAVEGAELGIIIGVIVFGLVVLALMIWLVYGTLYKVLSRLPPEYQRMSPGLVFLCLIPLFGTVWLFFVVIRTSDSLRSYFYYVQQRTDVVDCGKGVGLGWAICSVCSIIPFLGYLTAIAALVCMIIYLVRVHGLSQQVAPVGYPQQQPTPPPGYSS